MTASNIAKNLKDKRCNFTESMLTQSSIFVGKVARVEVDRTRCQVHSDCMKILPSEKSGLAIWQVRHDLHFFTWQTLSDLYKLSCLPSEFEKMNPKQKQKGVAMRFCDFPWHISTETSKIFTPTAAYCMCHYFLKSFIYKATNFVWGFRKSSCISVGAHSQTLQPT